MTLVDFYMKKTAFDVSHLKKHINVGRLAKHMLVGGAAGATGGAVVDRKHRVRGALVGAGLGSGIAAARLGSKKLDDVVERAKNFKDTETFYRGAGAVGGGFVGAKAGWAAGGKVHKYRNSKIIKRIRSFINEKISKRKGV